MPSVGSEPPFQSLAPYNFSLLFASSASATTLKSSYHVILRRVVGWREDNVADSSRHNPPAPTIADVEAQVESRCQQQQQRWDGVELFGFPSGAQDAQSQADDQRRISQTQEHGPVRRGANTRLQGNPSSLSLSFSLDRPANR